MIGLGLGKITKIQDGFATISLEKDKENPTPLNNLIFVENESNLVYKVIFNLLSRYNPETDTGSYFTAYIESLQGDLKDSATLIFLLTSEIQRLEESIKKHEDSRLSPAERLSKLDVLKIETDFKNNSLIIEIKITNQLNNSVLIKI